MSFWNSAYWKWIKRLLVIAAYGFLAYRLAIYDGWSEVVGRFASAGPWRFFCFVVAVLLFPVNIWVESLKWRMLLSDIEPLSIREAQRQTYFGFLGAFLTPVRLGDYPARVTMLSNKSRLLEAVALGFIGGLALVFVHVLSGMFSAVFLLERIGGFRAVEIVCAVCLVVQLLTFAFFPYLSSCLSRVPWKSERIQNICLALSSLSYRRLSVVLLLSFLRYIVYCFQLWLLMIFCGVNLSIIEFLLSVPAYYLLVTLTPSLPFADVLVRGGWSIVVFGLFTDCIPSVAIASVLLWFINSVLPMLVGTFVASRK